MSSASGSRAGSPPREADGSNHADSEEPEALKPLTSNTNFEDLSDDDSDISELDDALFENFEETAIAVDRPAIAVDETNVSLLGVHKRKRPEGEQDGDEAAKKKKKEAKREKTRKSRKSRDDDDIDFAEDVREGGERRKRKVAGERKQRAKARPRTATPEREEDLSPEEQRRRALDRAMDAALANPNRRRRNKKDEVDLEKAADEEVEDVKRRMVDAAQADGKAREAGKPAQAKLKMLPEVVALLNRHTVQHTILDPDLNFLEAVKFFLEPLSDGSLPAYNIQKDLFAALAKLPINTDTLLASGIGKVALFYTKSKRPELSIKRQAERLMGEWSRPILKRSDDYRQRKFVETEYDPTNLPIRATKVPISQSAAEREAALAPPIRNPNRARVLQATPKSYTVVPKSIISANAYSRPGNDAAFRKMKTREMESKDEGSGR